MNIFILYLLLLKASVMSFSGLGSLPMIRSDFVVERHLLTDRQVNTAVVAGRTGPGPFGLYLVCIGYYVKGAPGAAAAFLAMITPAFLVLPLMRWLGSRADVPLIRDSIRGVLLGSAGLLLAASVPLARDAITGPFTLAIVVASFLLLSFTKLESAWLMLGAAFLGLAAKLLL
ncbi:MAG TPA: chromate transporter [Bryobacteraceae bacterium]|nr:chromate transporter [Bryobacteraceae bacterium]